MSLIKISTGFTAVVLATAAITSQADNNWAPRQPDNAYWQAPNWSGFAAPPQPSYQQPANNRGYQPPVTPPDYRQPYNNYPVPAYRSTPPARYAPEAMPEHAYRGNIPPPPQGPYGGQPYTQPRNQSYNRPDNGASAYYTPGYNQYRGPNNNQYRNNRGRGSNRWNNNKFWGRSGPGKWMNPGKDNWENSWDDMINTPSRMGEMPGGWNAPEVTMPNPIDMGDQMQDNVKDLPEQMKNMDVGNDVRN